MSYLGRSAKLSLKAQEKVSFLATAGQTVKTGLSYTVGFIEVYVNGVLLTDTTDFTATNGSSVTFTVALLLNDEVTVISLKTFTVADHYSKTEADTLLAAKAPIASPVFTGNVGIGTSSPASKLDVYTTAATYSAKIKNYNGTAAGNGLWIDTRWNTESNRPLKITSNNEGTSLLEVTGTGKVGIGTSSPDYQLDIEASSPTVRLNSTVTNGVNSLFFGHSADADAGAIKYWGSAAGLGSYANAMTFNTNGTEHMRIDSDGIVTKPNQPAFCVTKNAQQDFNAGVDSPVTWQTESFDVGSNFASNTFTAPVDGKYFLQAQLRVDDIDTASAYYIIYIITSNRNSQIIIDPNFTADLAYMSMQNSGVFDMDAGDTAYVQVRQNNGHNTSHVAHGSYSYFSGYLLG